MIFNARKQHNRPRSSVVLLPVVLTAVLAWFLMATPTFAQVRGNYSPGSTLTEGGTVPDPGFSYSNQLWYGHSDELKGQNGKTLPIAVSVTVLIDNNTLVYVPKFKLLGANLEFSLDIAFSNGRLAVGDPLSGPSTVIGAGAGLTNTSLVPIDLGWHSKWADIQTGYDVSIPTGHFVAGAPNSVSSGYWTNSWQTGATLYVTKSKSVQISVFNTYAWNTTQQGTGVHPGQNDSVDYSVSRIFSLDKSGKWSLQFGPGGYGQWQTTNNEGQNPVREALTYGVDAAGFVINLNSPFKGLYVEYSAMWEYAARNTYQGRTMTFTVGFDF